MKNKNKYLLIADIFLAIALMFTVAIRTSENNQIEDGSNTAVYESTAVETNNSIEKNDHNTETPSANVLPEISSNECEEVVFEQDDVNTVENTYSRNLSENDMYLLAKLAMAEAEGESFETKLKVILVVLNRVESEKAYFPDTIEEVIFQKRNGVYQFTPIGGGRWNKVEPNEECWEAVNVVNTTDYDFSEGALYFEACSGESWHSRNLELICQSDNTRFYK